MATDLIASIHSHLRTAGPHVGDILWWTLSDARITRALLEAVWSDAGLSSSWLPEPPTPEKALRAAVRESQVGQANHLIRLTKDDERELVFAVVHENRDGAGNVTYQQQTRVWLARGVTNRLQCDDPSHEIVHDVVASYERLLTTHTSDDVRRALLKTLTACAAVTLRDHGGVYWVPAPYSDTLRRLKAAVSCIGVSRLDLVPIHASPEASAALGAAARSSLQDDIAALRTEIDAFLSEPPERAATLERRLELFNDLRAKAQLYHSVLAVEVQDLEADLNNLTLNVESLLAAKAAA